RRESRRPAPRRYGPLCVHSRDSRAAHNRRGSHVVFYSVRVRRHGALRARTGSRVVGSRRPRETRAREEPSGLGRWQAKNQGSDTQTSRSMSIAATALFAVRFLGRNAALILSVRTA